MTPEEIKQRLQELTEAKERTKSIQKICEIQDEIDQLTGEADRRSIELNGNDSDYECIGCSG